MKLMNLVHRSIRTLSFGRVGNTVGSMPVVELHAVGRKSGKTRMTMLTTPLHKDGSYVIVASKGATTATRSGISILLPIQMRPS